MAKSFEHFVHQGFGFFTAISVADVRIYIKLKLPGLGFAIINKIHNNYETQY